jgi:trimethylamine--corrinoid protein Co-methyltransferase
MGISGVDQAASLDMLVLQNEIIGYVESLLRELDFSDDALGLDVLAELSSGGSLIDSEHTVKHFRRELFFPRLLDRQFYQAWEDAGATSMEQRCADRKRHILATHQAEPLPRDLERELDRIAAAARREIG